MSEIPYALKMIRLIFFALIILLALLYSVPILLVRRLQHCNNILTVNFCLASLCFGLLYLITYIVVEIDSTRLFALSTCALFLYSQMAVVAQVVLALLVISINRLCKIVFYTNNFFKQRRWVVVCIASQWIMGFLIVLPMFNRDKSVRMTPLYHHWVLFVRDLIIPLLISFLGSLLRHRALVINLYRRRHRCCRLFGILRGQWCDIHLCLFFFSASPTPTECFSHSIF